MLLKRFFTTLTMAVLTIAAYAQSSIDTTETLWIGGIKQFVDIKASDRSKPLLLFVTGGPGEISIGASDAFTKELKKNFVFVQWDQRECGQTFKINRSPQPITLTMCQQDTHDLVDSLLTQFHRPKVFLMGWSWGTVLGFYMAKNYPEKLYAYMAVSPVINQLESERILLQRLQDKFGKDGNKKAIAELAKVKIPFENMEQVFYDRKWLFISDGQRISDRVLRSHLLDPAKAWVITLFTEASKHNFLTEITEVKCPIYFFIGQNDYQTNHLVGEQYYKLITAPKKKLFLFEKSGHSVPYSESDLFQQDIIGEVLPDAID